MPWKSKPLQTHQRQNVDYYLFVDESGEHIIDNFDTTRPFFTVSAVMLSEKSYAKQKKAMNVLKEKYWDKGMYKEKQKHLKKVCFVSRQIRRRQGAFSKHYLNDEQYEAFIEDLTVLMGTIEYKIIASSIDKVKLVSKYITPTEPYHLAMEFIIERFARFLHTNNATGLIMMESRGKKEDGSLHQLFLELYNNGTRFFGSRYIQKTITGGFYFNGKWNKQLNGLETFYGLELADLTAHPIGHFAQSHEKSRPFETFEKKFLGFEKYMGKGLKIFP